MKPDQKIKLNLTAILIQDSDVGGFTSYFAEFPEAVAEGDTQDEAVSNLFQALSSMIEFRKSESEDSEDDIDGSFYTKSFELEVA